MALPTLNYSQHLPPVVTSLPGYYILNSAQITKGNLNVNETIEHVEARLEDAIWPMPKSPHLHPPLPNGLIGKFDWQLVTAVQPQGASRGWRHAILNHHARPSSRKA